MSQVPLPKATEAEFARLIEWCRTTPASPVDVALLAQHLANSGDRLDWGGREVADVASTGGPGSLSTLVAPIALRAHGYHVVKLAVPGRPAGAIDSLGTIPGYRVKSSSSEVRAVVERCGFAHFLADERFAPLDAALFQYRRSNGAVAVPALAAASLLPKKLAVGVRRIGLDIRIGSHGNFGTSYSEARKNAVLFCDAARVLGIAAIAFLSREKAPAQPWVGRGESLVALARAVGIADLGEPDAWLSLHVEGCCRMADETTVCRAGPKGPMMSSQLRDVLEAHLRAQGADLDALCVRAGAVACAPRRTIAASVRGVLTVNLGEIRDALVALQGDSDHRFHDPAGIHFLCRPGDYVVPGEALASVRCEVGSSALEALVARATSALQVLPPEEGNSVGALKMDGAEQSMEIIRA